jgi:glycerophosphoryl diester phosphodiesterase
MDVRLSADGHPMVIHDARVDRTTNGAGAVSRLTVDQFQSLDAGSWFERRLFRRIRTRALSRHGSRAAGTAFRTFSGEPVPPLEVVLSLLAAAGMERIYVELKSSPSNRQALLEAVLSVVRTLRVERSVTLLSFDHAIVRSAREKGGDTRTAATFPARGRRLISLRSIVRAAESAGVDEVALHCGLVTRRSVDALHKHGLFVSVWTANSKLTMRRLVACGVDSIMTNFPDRLRDVLDSPSPRPCQH